MVCGFGVGTGEESAVGERIMRRIRGLDVLVALDLEWLRVGKFVIVVVLMPY